VKQSESLGGGTRHKKYRQAKFNTVGRGREVGKQ